MKDTQECEREWSPKDIECFNMIESIGGVEDRYVRCKRGNLELHVQAPRLYQALPPIIGNTLGAYGYMEDVGGDLSGVYGDVSGVWGDLTNVRGNMTGVLGDMAHVSGDLDTCDFSDEEREHKVRVIDLFDV